MKLKVITALIVSLFLLSIIAVATPVKAADSSRFLMIDIMAKGDDMDINGANTATTFIKGRIESDKGSFEFHIKIYDESGKKVYSMKGKLKNGMVIPGQEFECSVRNVKWINLWLVVGEGKYKASGSLIEVKYRGEDIILPNTEGKYVSEFIYMVVSPKGEIEDGLPRGGWAFAGFMGYFGGVTNLTKYMEKWVP